MPILSLAFEPLNAAVVGERSSTLQRRLPCPLHALPRLLGESEGQLKADTVAVDASPSPKVVPVIEVD